MSATWNYPFTLALSDGLPALLAGNAVVTKPDAQTVLSALLGARHHLPQVLSLIHI